MSKFTAYNAATDTEIPVKPIAIYKSYEHALLIADANTGKGIKLSLFTPYYGPTWVINPENADLSQTAEYVGSVFGSNKIELKHTANKKLAYFGFKLGKFDNKAGDRWELLEL